MHIDTVLHNTLGVNCHLPCAAGVFGVSCMCTPQLRWPVQGSRPGVNRVGRMEIGPEILGYGSSGTLVFEGTLDGRPIAVKRILCQASSLPGNEKLPMKCM